MFDVLPKQLAANNPLARLAWPGRMALLAVEDAAQLVFRAAAHASTRGRIFLASSNENPTTWEIAESIAAATSVPCRTIKFPGASAAFLRALLGDWWQAPIVPYALKVSAWRARLLLNGLYCDGTELAQLLEVSFRNWREGFARMYAEDPRQAQRVTPPLNI